MRGDIAKELPINEEIRSSEVRVISETGEQLGIMTLTKALEVARQRNLDLVEVAPNAQPPVCRLLDYGKFRYQQTKKEREARKHQKSTTLRQVRMKIRISEHDLEGKTRVVKKLLDEGDKVKISVMLRGRENTHPELAWKILQKISTSLKDVAQVEKLPAMEGRFLTVILTSGSAKPAKVPKEAPKETPKETRKEEKEAQETADAKAKNP